jgi:hypothetical protein
MDAIKNAAQDKLGKGSQPGNNVERSADNAVDQRTPPRVTFLQPLTRITCQHPSH